MGSWDRDCGVYRMPLNTCPTCKEGKVFFLSKDASLTRDFCHLHRPGTLQEALACIIIVFGHYDFKGFKIVLSLN